MNQEQIEATLIVQGYFLEILLMQLVYYQKDPRQSLDAIKFQAMTQMRTDMNNPALWPEPPDAVLLQAVDAAFQTMFDRVSGQLYNPAQALHRV